MINKGTGDYGVFFSAGDQKLYFEKVNAQVTAHESGTTDQAWHHWAIVQGGGSTDAIIYKDGVNVTVLNNTSTVPRHDGTARDRPRVGIDPVLRQPRRGRALQQGPQPAQVAAHYAARGSGGAQPPPDPVTLDGAILRLDPTTGAAMAGNPNAASPDANARRIVAYGHRNPFRFTFRPGTNELWIGDVGWTPGRRSTSSRTRRPASSNDGWPCYEGAGRQPRYDSLNLGICENLYAAGAGAVNAPYFALQPLVGRRHGRDVPDGERLVDLRPRVLHGRQLPGELQRRPVLQRLHAQVHLVHAGARERPPEHRRDQPRHRPCRGPGRT